MFDFDWVTWILTGSIGATAYIVHDGTTRFILFMFFTLGSDGHLWTPDALIPGKRIEDTFHISPIAVMWKYWDLMHTF